ncbi:MAG: UbiX family flavin prenyltransferase [Candidatus Altiarchaeota archaeon]|nr:UbiX family flavin prenyltransferase [Candidatus Altiarchaeota archaeon]
MKIIVAVTGASGVVIGKRLIEALKGEAGKGHTVHFIATKAAEKIAEYEEVDLEAAKKLADHVHDADDLTASVASSSCRIDAMAIVPCSMKTLSAIANGFSDNLITRAAENVLKTGGKLVVAPRDTPLSLAAIENMAKLKTAGALIIPPVMAYYYKPKTLDDATDFFAGKILDGLGMEHDLYKKWEGIR